MGWTEQAAARLTLALATTLLASCGSVTPRDKVPDRDGPDVLNELVQEGAARIVSSERAGKGARLVLIDESGQRRADLTELLAQPSVDLMPAWSPGGRHVAFASSRGRESPSEWSLWVIDFATREVQRLTDDAGLDSAPTWSPDGRSIAFASTRGGDGLDVFRLDLRRGPGGELAPAGLRRLTSLPEDELEPAWSPDGRRIALVASQGGTRRLRLMDSDGGGIADLTSGPRDHMPTWSPDGKWIVYAAPAPARKDDDLWMVLASGGPPTHLVDDEVGSEASPSFSVDGRVVLATSLFRDQAGRPVLSSLVACDLSETPRRLKGLFDRYPTNRLGVDAAPVPLDLARLAKAPQYREGLADALSWLLRRGLEEDK
ncbi:MAG: PD40 domain-containing protein [Deltaproteobacteria bacterium]|nr:PD40 domain-containing protein [Deltaproteobacteria bacterium]